MIRLAKIIIPCLFIYLTGCTATVTDEVLPVDPELIELKGKYRKEYVLVPGDTIEISVWQVPEVSRTVAVRPDGKISLPTVSGVEAAGRTFEELEKELHDRLSERLVDPIVTVIAVDIRPSSVYVLGDVTVQRAMPLREATTAIEAISGAGGFRTTSAKRFVSIIRMDDEGIIRAIPIEVSGEAQPSAMLNLALTPLQADDIVFVPESNRAEVLRFLDDLVGRPLGYVSQLGGLLVNYRFLQEID